MNTLLWLLMFVSTVSFAQETDAQQTLENRHALGLFIEGNTGTLVDNTDGLFVGNELTLAVEYKYNFMSVSWLSVFTRLGFIGMMSFNQMNINAEGPDALPGNEGIVDPSWKYNGFQSASVGVDYFETGLNFGQYGIFSVRARAGGASTTSANAGMLIKLYGAYPIVFGDIHTIRLMTGIEVNPFPAGTKINPGDPDLEAEGAQQGAYVDLVTFGASYEVRFHPAWSVSTGLYVRTSGHRYKLANSATGDIWEADTGEAFQNNLHLRWENTLTYTYNNQFMIWGQVRYQPERIAISEQSDSIYELTTQHEVFLRFGMNYFFDF